MQQSRLREHGLSPLITESTKPRDQYQKANEMFRLINNGKTEDEEASQALEKLDDQLADPGFKPSSV